MFSLFQITRPKLSAMKYLLLTAFALLFISTSAQYYNFDLSKYHLPEMKRQSLDFSFNGKGENRVWKTLNNESVDEEAWNKNNSSHYLSNINYSLYLNSSKTQTSLSFRLKGESNNDTDEFKQSGQAEEMYQEKELSTILNLDYNKKQFSEKNWFLMAESNSWLLYNRYSSDRMGRVEEIPSGNLALGIGGGKGRIEQVQDFRQAILMLNELEKRGVLSRGVTAQEMHELASLLSELKNERFFDARLRKETDLEAIDSLLTAKGLVDEKSISYYFGMEDMWTYGDLQVRESGNQLRFLGIPSYSFYNSKIDSVNRKSNSFSMRYMLEYDSRKPISVKWQRNYNIRIMQNYNNISNSTGAGNEEKNSNTQIYLNGGLGFYPNTRTYVKGDFSVNYSTFSKNKLRETRRDIFGAFASIGGYYYISERVRLNLMGGINHLLVKYNNEVNRDNSSSGFFYQASFAYAIF